MGRQVLFPTDFSPCAERAFTHAAHLTSQYAARLHILSVVDAEDDDSKNPMSYLPLGRDELAAELGLPRGPEPRMKVESNGETTPDSINVTLQASSPWRAILTYADENDIDLIVMGTHGRHGVDRILMGSVAEQVVRRAKCAVLTVRDTEASASNTGPIVVPVDFSTFTRGVLSQAIDLAEAYATEIHLVHVIEPITLPTVYGIDPMPAVVPDMEGRATEALTLLKTESIPEAVPAHAEVLVGHAAHEIVTYADDVRARMIVIATHGLTGLKRLLMGSVTEHVVREAACPVFTVRSLGRHLTSEAAATTAVDETAK